MLVYEKIGGKKFGWQKIWAEGSLKFFVNQIFGY